jgi:hypothetical protein
MMTQREQRVMDLHDRGFRNGEIALLLDMKPFAVGTIVSRYSIGDGGFEDGIRKGSRKLRQAIERAHPEKKSELRI